MRGFFFKKGIFSIFVETIETMIGKIDFLHPFEAAIEILSTDNTIEDRRLNWALYKLMCINDNETITQRLQYHYTHDITVQTTEKLKQEKTIKKTIAIVNQLQEYIKEKDIKGILYNDDILSAYLQIIDSPNLRNARYIYNKYKNKFAGFDFDVYRMIQGVSQDSEMPELPESVTTKRILLECLFIKYINEILKEIYKVLDEVGIASEYSTYVITSTDRKYSSIINLTDLPGELANIISNCKNKVLKKLDTTFIDKNEQLKQYCKAYPNRETNLKHLIETLDDIKDRYEIPYNCNKKKFATVIYILYRCQGYIGMKPKAIKTFTKFKNLMYLYFEMPENTYKENDVKELAREEMMCFWFKDYKFDDR